MTKVKKKEYHTFLEQRLSFGREIDVDKRLHDPLRIILGLVTQETNHFNELFAILGYEQIVVAVHEVLARVGQNGRLDGGTKESKIFD
mgnify:CR=1 FL=1